jgi:hypothetical protein
MGTGLGRRHPGRAQGSETVCLRREGVCVLRGIGFQEARGAGDADAVTVVDAAARDLLRVFDTEISLK